MKISELGEAARIAIEGLQANKLRSFLTTLGVVIGITFVILMGWFLNGLDAALESTVNLLGTDVMYVDKWSWSGGQNWRKTMARKDITYQQALEFCKKINTAELSLPEARKWGGTIQVKNKNITGISIIGVPFSYANLPAGTISYGRFFSQFEDQYSTNSAVLGWNVASTLFPDGDAIGRNIKIGGRSFEVVGVIIKRGNMMMDFVDNQVIIPISTFFGIYGSIGRSVSIAVKAGKAELMDEVRSETTGLMRGIRNVAPGEEDDFSINETQTFRDEVQTLRLSTWGIGIGLTLLSFTVGIIGIMNIMFVSVTERTKEIGIRKSLGAKSSSILFQFLVEAASLCFVGALIAFTFCSALIFVIVQFIPQADFLTPYVPPQLLLIAALVSIFVGILAGMIPAIRASKMDPVEALRYES
ncbi:MAG: ABC transporter permease [Bacteroidota bacterium]|jgi:putative ABC transport system permease protein